MNRPRAIVAFAAALLTALAVPAPAQDVKEQIRKLEVDRVAAVVKGDFSIVESATADDYTFINMNGQLSDKAQTLSALRSGAIKITSNELSDLKVRVYGDTAVVTGRADTKGTLPGGTARGPVLFTRVYVKKDGRWQAVAFQQTPIRQP